VPATERAFSEIPPAHLYLDTDIILDYLVSTRPFHSRSVRLLERIVEHGLTTIYLSSQSWMEFAHVIRHTSFRENLPDELLARIIHGATGQIVILSAAKDLGVQILRCAQDDRFARH